jgi:DNA-binding NarL/FixJ family response regulator
MSIRIIIADDHEIMREGLRAMIEKQPDMEIVAEAENGRTAVKLAREQKPDVFIMDVSMPDLNGIEATRQIVAEVPKVKVLALSMHSDSQFVSEMLTAGVSGYLLKDCAFEELTRAIYAVYKNQSYLSPSIAHMVIKDYVQQQSTDEASASSILTAKEREVLQLIAEGRTTKQIASSLHVSVKTIETHRKKIMEKLNIHSVAELTKFAIRQGLTSLET